jgi:hypothetical protein
VSKIATIGCGSHAIPCVVRDLSTTGAAIQIEDQAGIPEQFILFVREDGLRLSCRVVWRRGYRIGVTFD